MAIQKTPPLGWPHTEAAKYYDQESQKILQKAAPPPQEKKRSGCCGGTMVTLLIFIAIVGVIAAVVTGYMEGDLTDPDPESASDAYVAYNPNWTVEAAAQPDSEGNVELVTWEYDLGIGRVVMMEPDPYIEDGWIERPVLPDEAEWSEDHFYQAFSESYSALHWTYAIAVTPSEESTSGEDYLVSYRVWDDESEAWGDEFLAPAVLSPSEGWLIQGPEESLETSAVGDTP